MADIEDGLSDAELRAQLKQYGLNAGPVTNSTRRILLRKLEKLKKEGRDVQTSSKQVKKRRSVATSTPSRQSTKVGLSGFSSGEDEFTKPSVKSGNSASSAARRRTAFPKVSTISREKDNDSEPLTVDDDEESVQTTTRGRRSLPRNTVREIKTADFTESEESKSSSLTNREDEHGNMHQIRNKVRQNSFEFEDSDSVAVQENGREIRQRVSRRSGNFSGTETSVQRSPPKVKPAATVVADEGDMEEDNGPEDEELEVDFDQSDQHFLKGLKGPCFVFLVALLLVVLFGSYTSLFSSRSSELPALTDMKGSQSEEKESAFKVLQCLFDHLAQNAGLAECGYQNVDVKMNGGKVAGFADSCFSSFKEKLVDFDKLSVNVVNMVTETRFAKFFSVRDKRSNKSVPVTSETLSDIEISSKILEKPVTCRLKQALQLLSRYTLVLVLALGLVVTAYYVLKKRWMMDDEDTRLMFIYVERIIETLRRHSEACKHDKELPSFLPIPHVRDMLIPPRERDAKARAWKKAVDFLSSTDSRIRVETQRIAGEDFEVWRWIGVMTSDPKIKGAKNHLGPEDESGKFWQGPAFDKLEKVVRMPIITPTPCLKIRYLHGGPAEKEESWDVRVRDALLEKCQEDNSNILHVYVDIKSPEGCVYVKCDSLDSAGKSFRSIYGNWFDGRLVIVKFVTLARYHQRFPDALTCNQPLKPTGKFPSSLGWDSVTGAAETKTT